VSHILKLHSTPASTDINIVGTQMLMTIHSGLQREINTHNKRLFFLKQNRNQCYHCTMAQTTTDMNNLAHAQWRSIWYNNDNVRIKFNTGPTNLLKSCSNKLWPHQLCERQDETNIINWTGHCEMDMLYQDVTDTNVSAAETTHIRIQIPDQFSQSRDPGGIMGSWQYDIKNRYYWVYGPILINLRFLSQRHRPMHLS